jgi:molybdenum cofactor biosynthesis enzyme MoaA
MKIKLFEEYINYIEKYICPLCLERYLENIYIKNVHENISFKISSLQISVPLKGCINNCKSCIAKISAEPKLYKDFSKYPDFNLQYLNSMEKVKEKGCRNIVLTSDMGEPLQNKLFIQKVCDFNKQLDNQFKIEIQTTGVMLAGNIEFLKNNGVELISLSIFDIFDENNNFDIINVKDKLKFDVNNLCEKIKQSGINIRLSINLIKTYDKHSIKEIFNRIDEINPDQVTFKNLWHTTDENPINKWIVSNKASGNIINRISQYMDDNGGQKISTNKYSFHNKSIWLIDNCMLGDYIILRPDAKLYRSWDSLIPIEL